MSDETFSPEQNPENPDADQTPAQTPEADEGKNKRQMSFSVLDSGVIQANFGPGLDPVELDPAKVPETIVAAAVTEGLISRARGYTSKLTAENRTPEKLREAIIKAFENLREGVWKVERDGIAGAEVSIEAEAAYLFKVQRAASKGEVFEGTLEQVAAEFAKLTEDTKDGEGKVIPGQKSQLKALARYKACYAEVKAKRAAASAERLRKQAEAEEENSPL